MSDLADGLSLAADTFVDIFADLHDLKPGGMVPKRCVVRQWLAEAYRAGFHEAERRLLMMTREEARIISNDLPPHRWIIMEEGTNLTNGVPFRYCNRCETEEWADGTIRILSQNPEKKCAPDTAEYMEYMKRNREA